MNKIVSTKNTSAIFLAIVLVAGTITAFSPSFMVGAQAQPYYEMDNNYNDNYGKDSYKSKDSNKIVKKITCNNINVNVNGLELNTTSVPFLNKILASEGQDGYGDASSYGSGIYSDGVQSGYDNNNNSFKFVCINNNNNIVVVENRTIPEPPVVDECAEADEIEACFANAAFRGERGFPEFVAALESGINIEINGQDITLRSFEDICLAFEGLTTYEQLQEAVSEILNDARVDVGVGFFAVVDCIAEALDIPIPPR